MVGGVALSDGVCVGAVVGSIAVLTEVVFRKLSEMWPLIRGAPQQVVPLEVDDCVGLEVGSVTAGYEGEVDVFVLCGVADGVFDGSGKLVL